MFSYFAIAREGMALLRLYGRWVKNYSILYGGSVGFSVVAGIGSGEYGYSVGSSVDDGCRSVTFSMSSVSGQGPLTIFPIMFLSNVTDEKCVTAMFSRSSPGALIFIFCPAGGMHTVNDLLFFSRKHT